MFSRISKRVRKSLDWLRGFLAVHILLPFHTLTGKPIADLTVFQRRVPFIERKEFSQNGEDGILEAIFAVIGVTNRSFVEFGAEDGMQCNTRHLNLHKGWTGLLMDGNPQRPESSVRQEFITAENINDLFAKYGVPREIDLLSIDIDGNDYWVWKAIEGYRPRAVVVEYNACIPALPAVTIPYAADFSWDKTAYYGASLGALDALARAKGYTLVTTDRNGVNAFFVRDDLVDGHFPRRTVSELYHPAAFKGVPGRAHPSDTLHRPWVTVS